MRIFQPSVFHTMQHMPPSILFIILYTHRSMIQLFLTILLKNLWISLDLIYIYIIFSCFCRFVIATSTQAWVAGLYPNSMLCFRVSDMYSTLSLSQVTILTT